jgi:hypothetical protein
LPGDASIRLSSEGAASTHYAGFSASPGFLVGSSVWRSRNSTRSASASSRNWQRLAWRLTRDGRGGGDELARGS